MGEKNKYTVFISDTHFDESKPLITDRFIHFLNLNASSIEALYLLGDLFNTWLGDDDDAPFIKKISSAIANCSNQGATVYFMRGNRDFLIGKQFAHQSGLVLLNDYETVLLYGKPTLLMHGDLLCTRDTAYQYYRKIMFSPWVKKICLLLPLSCRKKIATLLRHISKKSHQQKTESIMDVSEESVIKALEDHHAQWLIHGHTHRPGRHEVQLTHQIGYRLVLGDWNEQSGNAIISSISEEPHLINFDQPPRLF